MKLDQLLSCLNQAPGDELLWLALADWLEEDGQPHRAELVRLNRRLRGMPDGGERWSAEERVRELLNNGALPCVPELVNSLGMRFALIPPGAFWMGSDDTEAGRHYDEGPRHAVRITRPYWLGVFPVTQAQYRAVTGTSPSHFSASGRGAERVAGLDTDDFPVEMVSWEDVAAYCENLAGAPEEAAAGREYRLPTEAEWEHACRAGLVSGCFHFGDAPDRTKANFTRTGLSRPSRVGTYPPNAFGLYDMHGNISEWCNDWWESDYYGRSPLEDPPGPEQGSSRVCRGGSWEFPPEGCRSAFRSINDPTARDNDLGFRLVLVPAAG